MDHKKGLVNLFGLSKDMKLPTFFIVYVLCNIYVIPLYISNNVFGLNKSLKL